MAESCEFDESLCKDMLEELGYEVHMPRAITPHQACLAVRMSGLHYPSDKFARMKKFRDVAMDCGKQYNKVEWLDKYMEILMHQLSSNPGDKDIQRKMARVEAGYEQHEKREERERKYHIRG